MVKKYRFGFDIWGLCVFLLVMIPNFIWFVIPAPKDILRSESVTPLIDGIGSVSQVLFLAAMCMLKRNDVEKIKCSTLLMISLAMVILYFAGWILYYAGIVNTAVIVVLTIPPCLAFILYIVDRKNVIAAVPAVLFTVCHCIYGWVNFFH